MDPTYVQKKKEIQTEQKCKNLPKLDEKSLHKKPGDGS